jgi:hypothetical protein
MMNAEKEKPGITMRKYSPEPEMRGIITGELS